MGVSLAHIIVRFVPELAPLCAPGRELVCGEETAVSSLARLRPGFFVRQTAADASATERFQFAGFFDGAI